MKIGSVDLDREVLVIAEIGNNHEGDIGLAEELVHLAADAGAQAVKFQSIVPEDLVAASEVQRLAQLRRFALSHDDHHRLAAAAKRAGVMFLSTPFSIPMVGFLAQLAPALKIASGDNDFLPLLEVAAGTNLPVILSTGMADMSLVRRSVETLESAWKRQGIAPGLVLLHCVSAYPTPAQEANLAAIRTLAQLGHVVGYSDHTLGASAAVLSVGLGARVIEKHFTKSKAQSSFRDHQLSAEPGELRDIVARVREANALLGDGDKRVMPSESPQAARRSAVAASDLASCTSLSPSDIVWLRPGTGIDPGQKIIGRRTTRSIAKGAQILSGDLEG